MSFSAACKAHHIFASCMYGLKPVPFTMEIPLAVGCITATFAILIRFFLLPDKSSAFGIDGPRKATIIDTQGNMNILLRVFYNLHFNLVTLLIDYNFISLHFMQLRNQLLTRLCRPSTCFGVEYLPPFVAPAHRSYISKKLRII